MNVPTYGILKVGFHLKMSVSCFHDMSQPTGWIQIKVECERPLHLLNIFVFCHVFTSLIQVSREILDGRMTRIKGSSPQVQGNIPPLLRCLSHRPNITRRKQLKAIRSLTLIIQLINLKLGQFYGQICEKDCKMNVCDWTLKKFSVTLDTVHLFTWTVLDRCSPGVFSSKL